MDLHPRNAQIVVGLVARIGVETKDIVASLTDELKEYGYVVHHIHLTDRLKAFPAKLHIVEMPVEKRYSTYIDACNKLRLDAGNDVMARFAVAEIVIKRGATGLNADIQKRNAYIVDQIKRPEEFEFLRSVYGEHFVQISCHATERVRVSRLIRKIAEYHPEDPKNPRWDIEARQLVHTDESQEEEPSGQRVRQVFPLSDIVIDAQSRETFSFGIERFFRALFGDSSVTPSREEYGMQLANAAAQRSSDLSRQVGASILSRNMEIKALGCNEVPRSNGGTYWENDHPDGRDFALGTDANEQRRQAVILDLMIRLESVGALIPELSGYSNLHKFLFKRDDRIIADSQIIDSLEYGRSDAYVDVSVSYHI